MPTILRDKVEVAYPNGPLVTFNDNPTKPTGSIKWGLDDLSGWDETPELDVSSLAIGGGVDGEILGDRFPARARHFMASGWVMAETRADAENLMDVIMRDAFPRNKDIKLVRYETIPKYLNCRVSAKRTVERVGPQDFRWIVPLIAGDPFKYDNDPPAGSSGSAGVAGQSSGGRSYQRTYPLQYTTTTEGEDANSVTLVNRGTAETYASIIVTGPLASGTWRISNETTGEDIKFNIALVAGDVMDIDFRNGIALLNGFPVTATITGDFWKLQPGPNVIKLFGDFDPAAGFTATTESAWE